MQGAGRSGAAQEESVLGMILEMMKN